ncbi:GNAT family N-acetyltransferase [Fulvivirgaceae bacterium BMA10]|uniref:GNAT family N-acetyltransferase n=1 Tax=Splendidivirga corallicola TaxID=3051826 RepID=A0ABT8KHN8_9BACT|nr:GNAT family N-acetyltransferase [Fulvivirgaceae bacterium BMA10]
MKSKNNIDIKKIDPQDKPLMELIASWYYKEWSIPIDNTLKSLNEFKKQGFPFQLVIKENNIPVATATGGLYRKVGLHHVFPQYQKYGPWIALLYTIPEKRGQGLGAVLCKSIEEMALELEFKKIYLYTFTAERLYLRLNWQPIKRIVYRAHDTVIMKKELAAISSG